MKQIESPNEDERNFLNTSIIAQIDQILWVKCQIKDFLKRIFKNSLICCLQDKYSEHRTEQD